jgi:ATP-dependent DNA helicase RecG
MKEWMRNAGLTTPPIIETDRDRNEFDLVLLPHHLLDHKDLKWLARFSDIPLSDAERRALIVVREMGAITNQDYRQINGTDTLTASRALGHLRDLGFLSMKGSGSETYYQLMPQIIENSDVEIVEYKDGTPYIKPSIEREASYANPLHKGLGAIPKGFPSLSNDLKNKIINLKNRATKNEIKDIIIKLCSLGSLQPAQLGKILHRDAQYLRINYLSEMIKTENLVYEYPDKPAHPQQAYKVAENGYI